MICEIVPSGESVVLVLEILVDNRMVIYIYMYICNCLILICIELHFYIYIIVFLGKQREQAILSSIFSDQRN